MDKLEPSRMEFHISRHARNLYQFDDMLFSLSGNVVFANFHAVRQFTQKINARRNLIAFPEQAVRAGQINAMGLIDEILHLVIQVYREQSDPATWNKALDWLGANLDPQMIDQTLRAFLEEFPPVRVYKNEISLDDYLSGYSQQENGQSIPNRQLIIEELLVLWLANVNPAFAPYLELFDDSQLEKKTAYRRMISEMQEFFSDQPPFGPENQDLITMLRSPALAFPHSLDGQLEYIRSRWGYLLGSYLYRLLSSLDLIKEEEKAFFGFGPGPAYVYDFRKLEGEIERFSPDRDWMPNVVLMAKNSYVWLDQLSKKYQIHIRHLDQIPDEELDELSRWGFTGLWLIGLWERSKASQRIKQMRGNPEAEASAYSLFSYEIAADLGGEQAFANLKDRLWQRGIRLASDMVPNHMGIDSPWVMDHPDWFISLDHSPFPSYSFNGPDLSWDQRVGIFLEDHYYNSTDAAVVFKRTDSWSGNQKYIYHGNDGTSMPWNDTAQLNYLNPEVRQAVIETILSVARKFPIIRFDAAMTLAKRHYQRLWFPEPGSGGDIPSRSDFGLSKAAFDQAFPEEFWREVVDRVAAEVPDTLLLAEAFWLMEGYFVRTLGMHRVYNSAFMNMLRDEKNQEYRLVIKNTLEFDPEILKRYVNFMNNPDERTAVDQFGKGDKYFGICTVMATLPGLPMFGHGQIEGFTEKYGMEYRRAYWDEQPDSYLVERHNREIFPLLRHRYVFAEARDFLLYDFYLPEGIVNEDVYAYSNHRGNERGLVIYNNRFANTSGWVRLSAAFPVKTGGDGKRQLVQKTLGEGLGLQNGEGSYTIFRDVISGQEYLRSSEEIHSSGLFLELPAYKYHVFMEFRQVQDDEWGSYRQLSAYLNGRGVPDLEEARKEIILHPIHTSFRELMNAGSLRWLIDNRSLPDLPLDSPKTRPAALDEVESKSKKLFQEINTLTNRNGNPEDLAFEIRALTDAALSLPHLKKRFDTLEKRKYQAGLRFLENGPDGSKVLKDGEAAVWASVFGWVFLSHLGKVASAEGFSDLSRTWIDEWLLGRITSECLIELGMAETEAWKNVNLIRLLTSHQKWFDPAVEPENLAYLSLKKWLAEGEIQSFLAIHRHQGILWFNKEQFDTFLWWIYTIQVIQDTADAIINGNVEIMEKSILRGREVIGLLQKAEVGSGYQVEKLLDAVQMQSERKSTNS